MRIVFDGRQVESLAPKVAKRIAPAAGSPLAEGVILPADQIVATAARQYRMGLGVLGGIIATILIGVGIFALDYEPADTVIVGPLYLAILAAMGFGLPAIYRRSVVQLSEKTTQRLARMAPPGTTVRADTTGLTLGERATPWADIIIAAVEIVTDSNPDGEDGYHVEVVVLDIHGQSVVLDRGVITQGHAIINKVLWTRGVHFR